MLFIQIFIKNSTLLKHKRMPNPKQKKIKKQKQQRTVTHQDSGQQIGQEAINFQSGVFSGLNEVAEEGHCALGVEVSNNRSVPRFQVGTGWAYILEMGQAYRISNSQKNAEIMIVDGVVDLNGKWYRKTLQIKQEEHLSVYTRHDNQQTVPETVPETAGLVGLNKNVSQILAKLHLSLQSQGWEDKLISEQVLHHLADYQRDQNALVWSQSNGVQISEYEGKGAPWRNLDPMRFIGKGETTMLMGLKNTGKSMFCSYLLNSAERLKTGVCILDLDIGRNMVYPACVSLVAQDASGVRETTSLWVGEYTPLNSISNYIKAMRELFLHYKQKYFTHSLIVNTMGYLTGIGELIIYETFNIIKPNQILAISSVEKEEQAMEHAIKLLRNGSYLERLHFSPNQALAKTSTRIQRYINEYAEPKHSAERFQVLISCEPLKSVFDIISLIIRKKLAKLTSSIDIYRQASSAVTQIEFCTKINTEMRVVLVGRFWRLGLFQVMGVAYGWEGDLYYDQQMLDTTSIQVGLLSDGIDFEKSFYLISEAKLIELEELMGRRVPYIQPSFKVLGSKGIRNNPGKKMQ